MESKDKQLLNKMETAIELITPDNFNEHIKTILEVINQCASNKSPELLSEIKELFGSDDDFNTLLDDYLDPSKKVSDDKIKSVILNSIGLVNNSSNKQLEVNQPNNFDEFEESTQSNLDTPNEIEVTDVELSSSDVSGEVLSISSYGNDTIDKVLSDVYGNKDKFDYLELPKNSDLYKKVSKEIGSRTPFLSGLFDFYKIYPFNSDEFLVVVKDKSNIDSVGLELLGKSGSITSYISPSSAEVNLSNEDGIKSNDTAVGLLRKLIDKLKSSPYDESWKAISTINSEYGETLGEGLREVINTSSEVESTTNFSNTTIKEDSNLVDTPNSKLVGVINVLEGMSDEEASSVLADIDLEHGQELAKNLQEVLISDGEEEKEQLINDCDLSDEELDKVVEIVNNSINGMKFSRSKNIRYKRYLKNFSMNKTDEALGKEPTQDDIKGFNKKLAKQILNNTVEAGKVIQELINMSSDEMEEVLDNVNDQVGKDVAEKLEDSISNGEIPDLDSDEITAVNEIIENSCDQKNFSRRNKRSSRRGIRNFSTETDQDTLVEEISDLTPEEASEALAELSADGMGEAADKLQAEVLKSRSEEHAEIAESLPDLSKDELEKAGEVIEQASKHQVNCSNSRTPYKRVLYKKYLSNFSDVLGEAPADATEVIEELVDSTPEEVIIVTSNLACDDKELADKVEDAVINTGCNEACPEFTNDEVDKISEVVNAARRRKLGKPRNFSRRLLNFSSKIEGCSASYGSDDDSEVDAVKVVDELADSTPEEVVAVSSEIEKKFSEEVADKLEDAVIACASGDVASANDIELTDEQIEAVSEIDPATVNCSSFGIRKIYHRRLANFSEKIEEARTEGEETSSESKETASEIINELADSTPEEVATVTTEMEQKFSEEVADQLEDEILKCASGEEVETKLTGEQVEAVSEIDPATVNCSGLRSKRIYRRRLANFSEKIESYQEEVSDAKETLDDLADFTPEEVATVTTEIEKRFGEGSADKVEDAIIAKASGDEITAGDVKEIKDELTAASHIDPKEVNCSDSRSKRIYRRRLANFSEKIESIQDEVSEANDTLNDLADSTPEEVTTVTTEIEKQFSEEVADQLEDAIIAKASGDEITVSDIKEIKDELTAASEIDPNEVNCSDARSKRIYRRRLANFSEKLDNANKDVTKHVGVLNDLADSTPEEVTTVTTEIEKQFGEDVADQLEDEVIAKAQGEKVNTELTDEQIEAVSEIDPATVNCSDSRSKRIYRRRLANFSEKIEEANKDATKHVEVLDELADSTPEEVAAVSTEIEKKFGEEVADQLEDEVIAKAQGDKVATELTDEQIETVSEIDPKEVNCSGLKSNKIYRRRLANFSKKIKSSRKVKLVNYSNTASNGAGNFIKKSSLGNTNIPAAGKAALTEVVGTAPYELSSLFFDTKSAKESGLLDYVINKSLTGDLIWRNKIDPKSPTPVDLQTIEIIKLGEGIASVRMYNVNSAKLERTIWSKSEDALNQFIDGIHTSSSESELRNYSEESEDVAEAKEEPKVDDTVNSMGVDRGVIPGIPVEIQVKPEDVAEEVEESGDDEVVQEDQIMTEIHENFSRKSNKPAPNQAYAKMFGHVIGAH